MSQLTVASAGVPTLNAPRFSGRKRKFSQPSKWANKRWATAPTGQMGGAITRIQQVTNLGYITCTNLDVTGQYDFKLEDLPNNHDFQTVFDMYRIVKVILHFIPLNNAIDIYGGNPPAVQSGGMLYTCKDYNDVNNPATVSEVASYQTCKFTPSYEKHVRSIKPLLFSEDESGGNIPFQPANSTWIPITKDGLTYCGIKWGINASPDATRIKYQVIGQYHVEFKNVK